MEENYRQETLAELLGDDTMNVQEETPPAEEATAQGAVEAVLFSMGEPLEVSRIAEAAGLTVPETKAVIAALKERYDAPSSGIALLELDGAFQLCTKKQYYENLITIAKHPKKPVLTDVVMETLSIIAYKQPVTRSQIESIRGVSSEHAINKLLEYELIRELGRLDVPGRPILFGTTQRFLRYFGMESTEELPALSPVQIEDFKAEAEAELDMHVDV